MKSLLDDVKAFHDACGVPVRSELGWPSDERIELRMDLNEEEDAELILGIVERDLVKTADAIVDSIYTRVGMALEFGIPLAAIWAEVQRANMAKVDPLTGQVKRREDGKVLKPDGWTPPDIAGALGLDPAALAAAREPRSVVNVDELVD